MIKAHYLQHVPFEGLGSIEPWLQSKRAAISVTKFFEEPALPDPANIDLLVIMGGPMSVNDEQDFPWLRQEKEFVRAAIKQDKAVVGICLGAQLIAAAMGAAVYPNMEKEIGWFPITAEPECVTGDLFSFPQELLVFHWHGDTFDLPAGAARLASSSACENQAFQLGRRVIGLQFHLETTPRAAQDIVHHCRDELRHSRYVQSEAEILVIQDSHYASINSWMDKILQFVTAQ